MREVPCSFRRSAVIICGTVLLAFSGDDAACKEPDMNSDLHDVAGTILVDRQKLSYVLQSLSQLGPTIAAITTFPEPRVSVQASSKPMSELLDKVIEQLPGYKWELSSGTIIIWPPLDIATTANRILNSTIPAFSSHGYDSRRTFMLLEGHASLAGLPVNDSFRRFARDRPPRGGFRVDAQIEVVVPAGSHLIDALNAVAQGSRQSYWLAILQRNPREILWLSGGSTRIATGEPIEDFRSREEIRSGRSSPYPEEIYSSDKLEHEFPE